jgi:hypothetical protein
MENTVCLNNVVVNGNVVQAKFNFEEILRIKERRVLGRYKKPIRKGSA